MQEALRALPSQGERLEYHEYIQLLKQSKLVLSPWGWGEWSHKVGGRACAAGQACNSPQLRRGC